MSVNSTEPSSRQLPLKLEAAPVKRFLSFVIERHEIWARRFVQDLPKPWTQDPILRNYRFCNAYRELDTVTRWISRHIRTPYMGHPDLWFMLCIARQINWPDTLQELKDRGAWPDKRWDPDHARSVMLARQQRGEKLYTGAYMIRGAQDGKDKARYTTHDVLLPIWQKRESLSPTQRDSLQSWHRRLISFYGWGSFSQLR